MSECFDTYRYIDFMRNLLTRSLAPPCRVCLLLVCSSTRCDGRGDLEVRKVSGEVGVLPVVHGSAHFVRGSTSALAVITLGRRADAQIVHDPLSASPATKKHFFAHYAFPMHSKNGRGRGFGANRREVGHSALIEKALRPVIPSHDDFPCVVSF